MLRAMSPAAVTVKFLPRGYQDGRYEQWLRQFPGMRPQWGHCRFVFDRDARDYDWLVVYEDLPRRARERYSLGSERLACSRARTILLTTEPSMVKTYGGDFLDQFGIVVTYQEPWAIAHPNLIFSHAGEHWFYGLSRHGVRTYDEMKAAQPPPKPRLISTVCSSKRQRHTLHFDRYAFTQKLAAALPELEVFGHGVRDMDDKAEALDPYRYHLAVENQICPFYLSEKLPDAFLAFTLPFYCGCPNVGDYFDPESYIALDMGNFDHALATIREALATQQYEKRLPAIVEARKRVLDEHNLFALLHRIVRDRDPGGGPAGGTILSRHALRRNPLVLVRGTVEKLRVRARHARLARLARGRRTQPSQRI